MSDYYKPIKTSKRKRDVDWLNHLTSAHDLMCYCDKPLHHTIFQILETEPSLQKDKEFTTKLQKWCTTGDAGDTPQDDGEDAGLGDLDKLFEEDAGEDDTG